MSTDTRERAYTPWWVFAVVVVAGLIAIGGFVSSASTSPLMNGFVASEVRGKSTPVQDGKLEFSVLDVRRGVPEIGDPYFGTSPNTGTYTVVTLSVRNTSSEYVTFDGSYVVGVDAQGDTIPSDREAQYYANDDGAGMLSTLSPGQEIHTSVAFDTPEASKVVAVQVHDSVFSRGALITFKR